MTVQQLLAFISQGETNTIEFKTRLLNQHDIAKVLTAFANTDGGIVIFGVQDNGNILGLPEEEAIKTENRLQNLCSSIFSYPFEIGKALIDGKYVVYANIDKAPPHLQPLTTATGEYYVRTNNGTIRASLEKRVFSTAEEKPKPSKEIVGFVAMSFRNEEEPALIDYYRAMQRAVEKTKLPIKLSRIDLQDGDYEISQQIMSEIDNCSFLLADFTLSPHNVYFEIGYARGAKKKIIQTARKGVELQFDVRNWNTLFYRNATELEEKLIPKLESVYKELTT
jgi:predicted HTH transcriptional regulator